jgi:D-alanine-D-alanine ligase
VVHNQKELEVRVGFIHQNLQTPALVEQYIEGREFYVGVLGHKKLTVFHPWELVFGQLTEKGYPIATRNVKFSKEYSAKKQIKRQAARGLSPHVLRRVTKTSREIYRALKLSGYARLDFRLTSEGQLFFLEANPNPELAKGECFANAARYSGWSYEQVIAKIIRLSSSSGQIAA